MNTKVIAILVCTELCTSACGTLRRKRDDDQNTSENYSMEGSSWKVAQVRCGTQESEIVKSDVFSSGAIVNEFSYSNKDGMRKVILNGCQIETPLGDVTQDNTHIKMKEFAPRCTDIKEGACAPFAATCNAPDREMDYTIQFTDHHEFSVAIPDQESAGLCAPTQDQKVKFIYQRH